jgi:hypothetical protein
MGLGPLTEGYALILSKFHYSCCAEIPEASTEEFQRLIQIVRQAQINLYGHSLIFEHGRSGACLPPGHGEDLCYHAHLHLLPAAMSLTHSISNDFSTTSLKNWGAVRRRYAVTGRPYILAQHENSITHAETPARIRPRYLRNIIARKLGKPELEDWVAFPSYSIVQAGRDKMAAEISRVIDMAEVAWDQR